VGIWRVSVQCEPINVFSDEWHRRDIERRATFFEAQDLSVIDKAKAKLAGGDELSDEHLRIAKVQVLPRQSLEKLSPRFFSHHFHHSREPGELSLGKTDLAFPHRVG